MRTRRAGPILPRMSTIVGNTAMTLAAQPAVSSPKAPRKVRLLVLFSTRPRSSLVNQTHELRFLVLADPELLFRHRLDAEFLFTLEIGQPSGILTCRSQTLTTFVFSVELRLQWQFGCQPEMSTVCSSFS